MSDKFREGMITIAVSALISVVITWSLLEHSNLNEKGYAVVFLIVWAMMGIIISIVTDVFDRWQD